MTRRIARLRPRRVGRLPWLLACCAIGLEVAYPLLRPGIVRNRVTIATVVTFFAASVAHAVRARGFLAAAWLVVVAAGGGFAAEYAGVHTGLPFGSYRYHGTLGFELGGVPVVVPLAWAMMAWPALAVGARVTTGHRRLLPWAAGWALAGWDVFLDPQMVDAGHWSWAPGSRSLPGVSGIPAQNFVAWLAVSLVLMTLLAPLAETPMPDAQPLTLYWWTYFSSILANLVWFRRPGVAAAGAIAMGVVTVPLARASWRG